MWERSLTYLVLIVLLLSVGMMLERAPLASLVGLRVVDWMVTRGALVAAVYLFWRLVRAYERRVGLEAERDRRQG